jgi:putative DNA primase/helicase
MTRNDAIENVLAQMRAVNLGGLTAVDLAIDGKLHRFRPEWEPKKKRGWYCLFDFHTDSGINLVSGSLGWFKGADSYTFNVQLKSGFMLSPLERARIDQEHEAKRRIAEQEREREKQKAADNALKIYNACSAGGYSKYLQRKKIAGIGCRFSRGSVVIPVMDFAGKLYGLQFIDQEGNKRFLTGTDKKGHFCLLGEVKDQSSYMGVCEGYATGVSCRMATQWPVFVAFDVGNLKPVAVAVRSKYPRSKIVILADDDFGKSENPGRNKAIDAARAVGGVALFPRISEVA